MNIKKISLVSFFSIALFFMVSGIASAQFGFSFRFDTFDFSNVSCDGEYAFLNDRCDTDEVSPGVPAPAPAPALSASLTASTVSIQRGNKTRLTWSSTGADSCTGVGFSTGGSTSGQVDLTPNQTVDYRVNCNKVTQVAGQCNSSSTCCSIQLLSSSIASGTRGTTDRCSAVCRARGMVSIGVAVSGGNRVCESQETRYNSSRSTGLFWEKKSLRCYYQAQKHDNERSDKVSSCYCGDSGRCNSKPYPYTAPQTTTTNTENKTASVRVSVVQPSTPTASVTLSPARTTAGDQVTIQWSSTDATSCSGNGVNGFSTSGRTSGSVRLNPTVSGTYRVTCRGQGGSASASATSTVTPAPKPIPTASLRFTPSSIIQGDTTTISWSSTNATSCTSAQFNTSGQTQGSRQLNPGATGTYLVSCSGQGGTATNAATVVVTPRGNSSLSVVATPAATTHQNRSARISWVSGLVSSCTLSQRNVLGGSWGSEISVPSINGGSSVAPWQDTDYRITCIDNNGSPISNSARIEVTRANLFSSSVSINQGDSVGFSWTSHHTNNCTLSSPLKLSIATGLNNSSAGDSPLVITTYTLTCQGQGGTITASQTVTVVPTPPGAPTLSFSASPTSLSPKDASTLTWSSTNTNSCTGTGFSTSNLVSGQRNVSPDSTTTYTVRCQGDGGSITKNITISVVPSSAPTATISASPLTVKIGEATQVSWSSTGANSCTSSQFSTGGATSGSISYGPLGPVTLTVTCFGDSGSAISSVVVSIDQPEGCTFNGVTIPDGSNIQAFRTSSVSFDTASCSSQQRTCSDGSLSGSYRFATCIVEDPIPADFECSKDNSTWTACSGVFTLVRPLDPLYLRADNTVENWYQCETSAIKEKPFHNLITSPDVSLQFTSLANRNAQVNFSFTEAAKANKLNEVSICLDSVNALDTQRTFLLKVLNFQFVES